MLKKQLTHTDHRVTGHTYPLSLIVHDMDSPANVGSLFRISDALGVEKIYLTGHTLTPPNTKLRKLSRATEKYVAYEYLESPYEKIEMLKQQGYRVVSLEITDDSVDLSTLAVDASDRICLILGSESQGVDNALLALSDAVVSIPMRGVNSSMNVASACAIAIYTLINQLSSD